MQYNSELLDDFSFEGFSLGKPASKRNYKGDTYMQWEPKINGKEVCFSIGVHTCRIFRSKKPNQNGTFDDSFQIDFDTVDNPDPSHQRQVEKFRELYKIVASELFDKNLEYIKDEQMKSVLDLDESGELAPNRNKFLTPVFSPIKSYLYQPKKKNDNVQRGPKLYPKIWDFKSKWPLEVNLVTQNNKSSSTTSVPYTKLLGKRFKALIILKMERVTNMNQTIQSKFGIKTVNVVEILRRSQMDIFSDPQLADQLKNVKIQSQKELLSALETDDSEHASAVPASNEQAVPASNEQAVKEFRSANDSFVTDYDEEPSSIHSDDD